jgi:hypothetical protein
MVALLVQDSMNPSGLLPSSFRKDADEADLGTCPEAHSLSAYFHALGGDFLVVRLFSSLPVL